MALTVETGAGVTGADSYASVATADTYFAKYGISAWSNLTTEQKEVALRVASSYTDSRWYARLTGDSINPEQGLALPQNKLTTQKGLAVTGVPQLWVNAVVEYALESTRTDLYQANQSTERALTKERVTIGPITTTTEYKDAASNSQPKVFPKADNMITRLFPSLGSSRVIR